MAWTQEVVKKVETKLKTTIGLYGKGNEIVFLCMYDIVFSWIATIIACIVVEDAHDTTCEQVGSTMTMSTKV